MTYRRGLVWVIATLVCTVSFVPALGAADDISGSWHFVLQTDGGPREAPASFRVDGGQVTGKFGDAEVKGNYKNGALDLAFSLNSPEVGPGTMNIKGSLASGALSGTWEFAGYSGTFVAKRPQ